MKIFRASLAFAAALLFTPALAQEAAPAAQPAKATDVKEIGDWTVRCAGGKSAFPCDMIELQANKKGDQQQIILAAIIAYSPASNAHAMRVSVPHGVLLANGLVIATDNWKSPVLKFQRCDQSGCYVESAIGNDVIGQLSRSTKASVQVVMIDGKRYSINLSLKGFTDAHNQMVSLAKSKVGGGAAPADAEAPAK